MAKTIGIAGLIFAIMAAGCGQSRRADKSADAAFTATADAKAKLLSRIEKKYGDADAHYQLGKLYHADGLWNKAEYEYNVAIGFDPAHWRAEAAIVKTLIESGYEDRSKLAAEHCMNRASIAAASSALLGRAFQKELLDDYALACYQQALALAPNSAAVNRQIGYYYLSKRQLVRAEEYLKRSFHLDPYQAEVAGELGRLGVMIQIPRTTEQNPAKVDKILNQKDDNQP